MKRTIKVISNHALVKYNNPKVGDMIWSLYGTDNNGSFSHVIIESISDDLFRTNKVSAQHIDNIWIEI